jgi:hypothetical protein
MTVSIHTVVDNLKKTIAGKEAYLARLEAEYELLSTTPVVCQFLKLNINELKVILHDVEQCAEQFSLMSWEINPERMGQ